MIDYRLYASNDYEKVASLIDAFCAETNADTDICERLKENVRTGQTRVLIAENGIIQGIGGYIVNGENVYSEFLYVVPEKRKGLIGGTLFRLFLNDTKNCKRQYIFASPEIAPKYQKSGFKVKGFILEKEA